MKKILALLMAAMLILAFTACGMDSDADSGSVDPTKKPDITDKSTPDISDKNTPDNEKANDEEDKGNNTDVASEDWVDVGESIVFEDLEYVVNAVMRDNDSTMPASDGNTFYLVDMSIFNETEEDASVSSLLMFELKDDQDNVYDISFEGLVCLDEYGIVQADGDIPASSYFNCGVAFEVPEDAEGLTLVIKSFTTDETAEVVLE